jgi:enoyl-CoA hydratase/carnithine racemase
VPTYPDRISVSVSAGIADVRLTRTDKMNALDERMFEAIIATGEALSNDPAIRCVVLSGEGRAFCAGIDLERIGAKPAAGPVDPAVAEKRLGRLAERSHGNMNWAQKAVMTWREIPVPVIAAVHGFALGGGLQIMLGADMRYIAPDTKLSVMETKWGIVPDMAGTFLMRGLIREDLMRELVYTARIFSGTEALQYGFATRVCADPRAEAFATAREIAERSPSAIEAAKRLINNLPGRAMADILLSESVAVDGLKGGDNQREAIASQLEKRPPRYRNAR